MKRPRVLLADDHRLLREAFAQLLAPGCDVVGAVADGRALLAEAPALRPDIVILDISMPLLDGLDAGRQLKAMMPEVRLIFLTVSEDFELAAEALRLGASGYLLKNSAASELIKAIQDVFEGRPYVTPLATPALVASLIRQPAATQAAGQLTSRQREVLQLLAEGRSMKQIARTLAITPRTVAFHKYSVMQNLEIRTNAELVQFAIRHHIVNL